MYVPLYTKSVYSLLKSALKIEDYVKQAKKLNMPSLALCDEEHVYGLIKFYKECVHNNIKPILGLTIYLDKNSPLILYAKDNEGYHNLLKISTEIQVSNKLAHFDKLTAYFKHLICIIPIDHTAFSNLFLNNQLDIFYNLVNNLKRIFRNDLYLAIHPEFEERIVKLNQITLKIGREINVKLIAINEIKYLKQTDFLTLQYLQAIEKGEKIVSSISLEPDNHYFLSVENFHNLLNQYQEAISNTILLSDSCNVVLDFNTIHLPKFNLEENITKDDYLKLLCKKGLEKRLNTTQIDSVYLDRLKYELQVITKMNFSDYFLIVYDFVKYAKKNQIAVGPGRGSAAGSLVSYCLGITNVDPIKYNLMFERFLNPERITMPDIDMDFQDNRRDEVIKYVQNKYGEYHVAHIIAFGTFASRSAIREIAKVMDIKDSRITEIISYIDSGKSIKENVEQNSELRQLLNDYQEINKLFTIALAIEGIPRNTTTHAAGVIICENDLSYMTGLQKSIDDVFQTQYEASDLEALGLVKIDFLGLKNLSTISEITSLIKEQYQIEIDLNNIPLDDAKTYRLIARGETTGVFQLESNGMKNVLVDIEASNFEDIVAVNALYRPGPMENISTYIARRHNKKQIEYLHKDLIPILESTYGIIVYQEQVMMIATKIAGYSLAKADLLRRAISKKQKEVLEQERITFVNSSIKNGYDESTAIQLYDYIVKFGDYGFNRSHSVAYSYIAYQMAYLKANYLTPFMVVLLKSVTSSEEQTRRLISDCKRYGLKVLPISINQSDDTYKIENTSQIRMSLLSIKGLGTNTCQSIINERKKGIFQSFFDFIYRSKGYLKHNVFESLVYVGALDEFNLTKKTMIENYNKIYDLIRFNPSGYFTDKIDLVMLEEYPSNELMKKEKEYLGFYLSSHPIRRMIEINPHNDYIIPSLTLKYLDKSIELIGYIESVRKTITKNNEEMAQLNISDDVTSVNGVVFPKVYKNIKDKIKADTICTIQCKVQEKNQKVQLIIFDLNILK